MEKFLEILIVIGVMGSIIGIVLFIGWICCFVSKVYKNARNIEGILRWQKIELDADSTNIMKGIEEEN